MNAYQAYYHGTLPEGVHPREEGVPPEEVTTTTTVDRGWQWLCQNLPGKDEDNSTSNENNSTSTHPRGSYKDFITESQNKDWLQHNLGLKHLSKAGRKVESLIPAAVYSSPTSLDDSKPYVMEDKLPPHAFRAAVFKDGIEQVYTHVRGGEDSGMEKSTGFIPVLEQANECVSMYLNQHVKKKAGGSKAFLFSILIETDSIRRTRIAIPVRTEMLAAGFRIAEAPICRIMDSESFFRHSMKDE